MEPDAYETAAFYDVEGSDRLTHETEWEAIEALLDGNATLDGDPETEIRACAPLTVVAYDKDDPAEWINQKAEAIALGLVEDYDDEFGDPEGRLPDDGPVEAFRAVIECWVAKQCIWRCHKVGERTFDGDQLVAMARVNCPVWFEDT